MGEKYRGLISGSVCFGLNREETIALLQHQGEWDKLSPAEKINVESSEIAAIKGKVSELENMIKSAGINIVTLYD